MPFTVYLATAYMGAPMKWDGSTAREAPARALSWRQLDEMVERGCAPWATTRTPTCRPEVLTDDELDLCTSTVEQQLGVTPGALHLPLGGPGRRC